MPQGLIGLTPHARVIVLEEIHEHRRRWGDGACDAGPELVGHPAHQHRAIARFQGVLSQDAGPPRGRCVKLDVPLASIYPNGVYG